MAVSYESEDATWAFPKIGDPNRGMGYREYYIRDLKGLS